MISVIIPAYNCRDTLAKAVHSLLGQSYSDFEIIIINDGSEDNTEEVAQALAQLDSRIHLFTVSNAGVSAARNTGIDSAKGEYICFVDSDDYVEQDYLKGLIDHIGDNVMPCVGFAVNDAARSTTQSLTDDEYLIGDELIRDYLCGVLHNTVTHVVWNKLFSAEIIDQNHLRFNRDLSIGEDMLFVLQYLCSCKRVWFTNEPLYHYTIRQTSAMRSDQRSILADYDRLLDRLKKLSYRGKLPEDETLSLWSIESISYALLNGYVTSMRYREFAEYCAEVFSSELYRCAVKNNTKCSFKRGAFRYALRKRKRLLLYLILKAAGR